MLKGPQTKDDFIQDHMSELVLRVYASSPVAYFFRQAALGIKPVSDSPATQMDRDMQMFAELITGAKVSVHAFDSSTDAVSIVRPRITREEFIASVEASAPWNYADGRPPLVEVRQKHVGRLSGLGINGREIQLSPLTVDKESAAASYVRFLMLSERSLSPQEKRRKSPLMLLTPRG